MAKTGGATGGMEYSPGRVRRRAAARKGEERRWAAKAGPVEVHQVNKVKDAPGEPRSGS